MIFYQLVARGSMALSGGSNKIHSKKIFDDRKLAEDYKKEFEQAITVLASEHDLCYFDTNYPIDIHITELQHGD